MDLSFHTLLRFKYTSRVSDPQLLHAVLEKTQMYRQGFELSSQNGLVYTARSPFTMTLQFRNFNTKSIESQKKFLLNFLF